MPKTPLLTPLAVALALAAPPTAILAQGDPYAPEPQSEPVSNESPPNDAGDDPSVTGDQAGSLDDPYAEPAEAPAAATPAGFDSNEQIEAAPGGLTVEPTNTESPSTETWPAIPDPAAQSQPSQAPSTPSPGPSSDPNPLPKPSALAPSPAFPPRATLDNTITGLALLSYRYPGAGAGLGLGAYYQKTVLSRGAIQAAGALHDELAVEGGLEVRHYAWRTNIVNSDRQNWSYTDIAFSAAVLWNIWPSPELVVYPRLGLSYGVTPEPSGNAYSEGRFGGLAGILGLGAAYRIGPLWLRGEFRAEGARPTLAIGASYSFH